MPTITRVRDDKIQAGKTGRAGDVSAELDNIITAHNTNDGRIDTNEADIATIQGDLSTAQSGVTTLQGEMDAAEARLDTNEADIANLLGSALTPQVTKTGTFTLLSGDDSLVVLDGSGTRHTCTLPQPLGGSGFSPADRWLLVCRSTGGYVVTSNYFGPATMGKEILLLDGDACMATVIDDPVLSTQRWSVVVLRADVRRYDWYEMVAFESVTVNPNRYLNYIAPNGGTVTLPPISGADEMVGLDIAVHNRGPTPVTVEVDNSVTELIRGGGSGSSTSRSIAAYSSFTFRAGPNSAWFMLGGS